MISDPTLGEIDRRTESPDFRTVVDIMAQSGRQAAFQTALRTRSPMAINAIAELASPGSTLDDIVALAHEPDPEPAPGQDPAYLCAIAGVLYSQGRQSDSFAVYSLAAKHLEGPVPQEHQVWFARSALHTKGGVDDLPALTGLSKIDRLGIESDAIHPSTGGDESEWLERFRLLTGMPDLVLSDDRSATYLDRLGTEPVRPVRSSTKISIIMTCYEPGVELFTAIRSVLAQSWRNWELLIVDDASGERYHPILAEARALDTRIKLLMLPQNSGTYEARNRALAECSGNLVTGLDSDDWAHPRWLELQAEPLLTNRKAVMSVSGAVRVHSDLTVTKSSRAIRGPRSTSIMFKANRVRRHMGFFDAVRKGADTEFRMRFAAVFGKHTVKRLTDSTLTLVRLGDETLTSSEFSMGWLHPARLVYQSAHRAWHQEIRAKTADPFVAASAPERPFLVPDPATGHSTEGRSFDQIFVTDCRFMDEAQEALLQRAVTAADAGHRIGLMHIETLHRPMPHSRPLAPEILATMHTHGITFLSPTDAVETDLLIAADASLWEGRTSEYGLRRHDRVEVGEPMFTPEPWVEPTPTEPQGQSASTRKPNRRPAPRPAPGLWALRYMALTVMALAVLTSFVAWPLFDVRTATIISFITVSAGMFGLHLLTTASGYRRLMAAVDRKTNR